MKILKQLAIIFSVSFAGTLISYLVPFPMPATIASLFLMLILLAARIIKEEQISTVGDFLLGNMAFFFIPSTAGVIDHLGLVRQFWVQILAICFISTLITFAVTGLTVTLMLKLLRKEEA